MIKRFQELVKEKIFTKENEHYRLSHDWENKLENIIRQRNLTKQMDANKFEQSYERSMKEQHHRTLDDNVDKADLSKMN
jgi:hypothetical protein